MIYICIPAFNEAATIGVLLWKIRRIMLDFPRDYQLLVLDDGSTDETAEVLAPYTSVLPLSVLRNKTREGYASALERLIGEAVNRASHPRRDVVVVLQADFTEAPADIPALVKRIEGGADLVSGNIAAEKPDVPRALRWSRRGLPWILRRTPFAEVVRDPLSGFRAYRVSVLKRALAEANGDPLLSSSGWAANAELLLAVAPHARRAEGAEIARRYDLRQRATRFRSWPTLLDVWGLSRRARRWPPMLPSDEPQ